MNDLFMPKSDTRRSCLIGGKAENLLFLQQHHDVPEWIALPASVFIACLEAAGKNGLMRERLSQLTEKNASEIAHDLTAMIRQLPFPPQLEEELKAVIPSVFGTDFISVRSSAADEDGARHSFAGIHESFLHVRGSSEIQQRIRDVWASGYQERALLYRLNHQLTLHPVPMAVILQRMINAQVSGVMFTADPATRDPHRVVISALYGLGEGLVSAGLEADMFAFDKRTCAFTHTIVQKETQVVFDSKKGSGVVEVPVGSALQSVPSLTDEQLRLLVQVGLQVEKRYGKPQDIEFCFDEKGRLYLLQARSVTTVDEYGPAAGNHQIWDNSNIIESYSGVTSPMTFSFIRHAYSVVYTCFSEVMGIPAETIRENQTVYRNMLGLFDGQVFYNLPNWYRLVRQFPGYAYNKAFMESMMGVKETADAEMPEQRPASGFRRYFVELPKLLGLACRMLYRFKSLASQVPAFNAHFNHYYTTWAAMDFKRLQPYELMQVYQDMEKHLLRNWKTPIINDFYVMVFYGTLKACCKKWCGDEQGTLQNNLICGEGEIESTQPTRMLMRLALRIKEDPALVELFRVHSPAELLCLLPARPAYRPVTDAVQEYLRLYGFRCVNELKLEEPSLHDTPEFVYQMIANYLRMDAAQLDIAAQEAREKQIRAEAEQRAFSALSPARRVIFRMLLKHARTGVKNRENMRFARTKIYGLLRLLLQAMGGIFAREGLIQEPHDIFYLTLDEVWDYIKGTAVTRRLSDLIALRKSEFEAYRTQGSSPDDHFETYGMAYHRNRFKGSSASSAQGQADDGTLRGIGCSPGVVEGVVRIIHSPRSEARLNGEILVAARTDPGWVPLYPSVSGLLIERGSILSHSAIVAREMGLPAIVGIPNLLKTLRDGQRVRMDASSGTVTILT